MSKENAERRIGSKKKQKDLDSVLNAALDDLDEDEEECGPRGPSKKNNANISCGSKQKPKKVPRAKTKKRAENQIDDTFSEEDLAASLEDVMKSLLQAGEQLESMENNDEEGAADEVLENLMKQMQAHAFQGEHQPPNPKTSQKQKKKQQPPPSSSKTTTQQTQKEQGGTDVDRTVAQLLDDMAKANAASTETAEAANFDQMGEKMMESMMAEMQNMAEKEDADNVIDGMMKQLLSKELMYPPMKQVTEKFPKWLAESKDRLSEEEYNRYGHQYQYFQRIVAVYETDAENFPRLMELMQDIQEYGQPPAEIIKELAPGLEFDEEGMPKMDGQLPGMPFPGNEQCNVM